MTKTKMIPTMTTRIPMTIRTMIRMTIWTMSERLVFLHFAVPFVVDLVFRLSLILV